MTARNCIVPLIVRLRGIPDDERLSQASDAIARCVAGRLAEAGRVIAAREGWTAWRKAFGAPKIRFSGPSLDDELQRRVAAAVEEGISRALSGGGGAATPSRAGSRFLLADFPVTPTPAPGSEAINDGLKIAPGGEDLFWNNYRSMLFTRVENKTGIKERDEAINTLLQGIRRKRAQALIREALDRPASASGVRMMMILALGKIGHDRPIAWRLLLYGLERSDYLGHGPFKEQLDRDPGPLIDFLESVLSAKDEPYRSNAARVVRRYLEGQYDVHNARHRRTYERLRALAARFALYGSGPQGVGATRDRIERAIDLLIDTVPAITDPLTPAAPRETPQTSDEHTLTTVVPGLIALKASLGARPGDALAALDTRLTAALEMAFVLPDRIATIQRAIRGIAKALPNDTVPSDEIVVLQRLRRQFLLAFLNAPNSDQAINDFNDAEADFANLRDAVADVKFERLRGEFDTARAAVGTGVSLYRSGGVDDATFPVMRDLLLTYERSFANIFVGTGANPATFGSNPVMIFPTAASLESATQLETDLALFRLLGSMFLFYAVSLRYQQDIYAEGIGYDDWRGPIASRLLVIRGRILQFWNHEDYAGFVAAADDIRLKLDGVVSDIRDQEKRDRDTRLVILLAATLVAGVAGVLVRAALIGTMLEAAGGATRLAVAVTLTEATAFTATQVLLERAAFGKPLSVTSAAQAWITNLAQFAAFGALSRVLGPLGSSGGTWLAFLGRHAAGLTLQVDIAALSLAVQGRGFPPDIGHFLIETIGAYAIGATVGYVGGHVQNAAIEARKVEFERLKADILLRFVNEATRAGRVEESSFNRTKAELLEYWARVGKANDFLLASGLMSAVEHREAAAYIAERRATISSLKYQARPGYTGPLLLEPARLPGLVKVGQGEIYRYDPQRPPPQLGELARSYRRVGSLTTTFEHGTLVVRELGSRRLVLQIGPGPVPAGLLPPPTPGAPPPRPPTFLESAAGGPLTRAGTLALTAMIEGINRNAIPVLQGRGDSGLAALSLLVQYRWGQGRWSIDAIRGLATALELPRAITRSNLERFFARPSSETAQLFEDFGAIADMPGANLLFRQPATPRTIFLVGLYRELRARNLSLPQGMNDSAERGLMTMVMNFGREVAIERIRALPVDRRLAEFIQNDPLATKPPPLPASQQILDRHAGDIVAGINLADQTHSPAEVRAQIEAYARSHNGGLDSHIPARIEATIRDYRATLRRVQTGVETDSRNLDGVREEFRALFLALDRGAKILSFSRMLGAAAHDPFQAEIDVGWHPLRGKVTVQNAPKGARVQLDILAHTVAGVEIEEVTFGHMELPVALRALATATGPVTVDHSKLNDSTTHRKWKQIFKYIALAEFGEELARAWGGTPERVRIVVRARSVTEPVRKALAYLQVDLVIISPTQPPPPK